MDEGEEVVGSPVVAGCDAPEVLEPVEAAFDAVSQFVEGEVVGDEPFPGRIAGYDGLCAFAFDEIAQGIAVVGFVGDHVIGMEAFEEGSCLRGVAALARGEDHAHRTSLAIDGEVDLGGQSSSGASQSLVLVPPFPVAAC